MVRTFSNGKKIYSVDMLLAYVNIYKPKHRLLEVEPMVEEQLSYPGWGEPTSNKFYSALDVIKAPKKYKSDMGRITNANLYYPIIILENHMIVDGIHRLAKAHLTKQKKIKAYVITKKVLNKCLINRDNDWDKVSKLNTYDFIKLFHKRFC